MSVRVSIVLAGFLCAGLTPAEAQGPDMAQHLADLLAQCPATFRLAPDAEAQVPIHVTRFGNTGPKVLIIHGGEQSINAIGGGPANFAGQEVLGEEGWQISVPDRPGFGSSPSRGRDDQLADVRWIAQALRDSGGSNLWGHSFGGAEALLAAAAAPKSVRSLVLIEPALWPLAEMFPAAQVPKPVQEFREGRVEALAESKTPRDYAEHFLATFQPRDGGMKVWFARHALKLAPGLSKKVGCGALQAHEADGAQFLKAIETVKAAHIPVLVITGGWDPDRDALGSWVAGLVGGTHVIVPSTDHIVMKNNPTAFNKAVVAFMRTADGQRAPSN